MADHPLLSAIIPACGRPGLEATMSRFFGSCPHCYAWGTLVSRYGQLLCPTCADQLPAPPPLPPCPTCGSPLDYTAVGTNSDYDDVYAWLCAVCDDIVPEAQLTDYLQAQAAWAASLRRRR